VGWGEKALSTLVVVGESCRMFLRKLECTAGLQTLTATPVEGVDPMVGLVPCG
jgi:hypothetical protein